MFFYATHVFVSLRSVPRHFNSTMLEYVDGNAFKN